MNITFPSNTRDTIEKIINTIGRDVTFYYVASSYGCPDCTLNPVTNKSTDQFCTTCSGEYWIPVYSGITMSAHVTWKDADKMNWATGGQYFAGDCKVKVMYTASGYDIIQKTERVEVDSHTMKPIKITLLGVPSVNRIIVHLKEEEH